MNSGPRAVRQAGHGLRGDMRGMIVENEMATFNQDANHAGQAPECPIMPIGHQPFEARVSSVGRKNEHEACDIDARRAGKRP